MRPECEGAGVGDVDCSAIGGFLMSWVDEYWKGSKTQASCKPTYDNPKFSPKTCRRRWRARHPAGASGQRRAARPSSRRPSWIGAGRPDAPQSAA